MEKGLLKTFMLFTISLLMLVTSIFAWFSISNQTSVGNIVGETANIKAELSFYVKKNDNLDYTLIYTINEMKTFFGNMKPSDRIHFKISVKNTGNIASLVDIVFPNVESDNPNVGFDILDIYYLKNGEYKLYKNQNDNEDFELLVPDQIFKPYESYYTAEVSNPVIIFPGEENQQELSAYRLSNITDNKRLAVLTDYNLAVDEKITMLFTVIYDEDTSHMSFTEGIFRLNKIFVYLK